MKCHRTLGGLVLGIILPLLLVAFPATLCHAEAGDKLIVFSTYNNETDKWVETDRGQIGDRIELKGSGFVTEQVVYIYFSSDKANEGDNFDSKVTTYKRIDRTYTEDAGEFCIRFTVPSELTDGKGREDVHYGDYYVYVVYLGSKSISAVAAFTVIDIEIKMDPEEGKIGDWVKIDGDGFDASEQIPIYFSSDAANIGDYIDNKVTAYELVGMTYTNTDGDFDTPYYFAIPDELTHGKKIVQGGSYYVYTTYYFGKRRIEAVATFTVISSIALYPDEGTAGTEVEISSEGLHSNQEITIKYDGDEVDIASGDAKTDNSGKFTCTITIPESTAGDHTITVTDESGNKRAAKFKVEPRISIDPTSGATGTEVEISGEGLHSNQEITIKYDGDEVDIVSGDTQTDNNGKLTCAIIIPESTTGDHTITVTDESDNKHETKFRVAPQVTIDPTSGHTGTEVKIIGKGLHSNQEITITYDGVKDNTETDSKGQFTCTIIIPESTAGDHIITITDESGNKWETRFKVEPGITIDPTSGAKGAEVKVIGTGFGETEYVTITINGEALPTTPASVQTNRHGSFNGSFIIPVYPPHADGGTGKIKASDSFNTAETQLTVLTISPTTAVINLSPSTSLTSPGHVGMELIVDGTGFMAGTTVTVTYDNNETAVATTTTDASGSFSATFTVPPSGAGSHVVNATDGTDSVTSTFTMESEAPPTPVLLTPTVAVTTKANPRFDWEDVTDPSGIRYILQIGRDVNFTAIVLEKAGLSESEYRITEEEKLHSTEKRTPYYWRVKAVDGTSRESEWTSPQQFYVNSSRASLPVWVYVCLGYGAFLLIILGFWARKRFAR